MRRLILRLTTLIIPLVALGVITWIFFLGPYLHTYYHTEWEANTSIRLENHDFDPSRPLADRILSTPTGRLRSLWNGRFTPRTISPDTKKIILEALEDILSPELRVFLEKRLVAIVGGEASYMAGFTGSLLKEDGTVYFYIILNIALIEDKTTTPMKSLFYPDESGWTVRPLEMSTQKRKLETILLHEIGHGVDGVFGLTDHSYSGLRFGNPGPGWPVGLLTWKDYDDLRIQETPVYRGNLLSKNFKGYPYSDLPKAVAEFEKNDFVSIYASANWREDWAETWTLWHLHRIGWDAGFELTSPEGEVTVHKFYKTPGAQKRLREVGTFYAHFKKQVPLL